MKAARMRTRDGRCCEFCAFWELTRPRAPEFQNEGLCRRRAPSAVPTPEIRSNGRDESDEVGFTAAWPRTFAEDDWCGEFVAKWAEARRLDEQRRLEEAAE